VGNIIHLAKRSIEFDPDYQALMREVRRRDGETDLDFAKRLLCWAAKLRRDELHELIGFVACECEREGVRG
jgi:hypothetical protein